MSLNISFVIFPFRCLSHSQFMHYLVNLWSWYLFSIWPMVSSGDSQDCKSLCSGDWPVNLWLLIHGFQQKSQFKLHLNEWRPEHVYLYSASYWKHGSINYQWSIFYLLFHLWKITLQIFTANLAKRDTRERKQKNAFPWRGRRTDELPSFSLIFVMGVSWNKIPLLTCKLC